MRYILDYGAIYKMTNKNYKQYFTEFIQNDGKCANFKGKIIGQAENITDLSIEQAKYILESLNREDNK